MGLGYKITYTRRRSVALRVTLDGGIEVRAPRFVGRNFLDKFVSAKEAWIKKQREKIAHMQQSRKQFAAGERFLFLGKEYPLVVEGQFSQKLRFNGEAFLISKFKLAAAKSLFVAFYKLQAQKILMEKLRHFAAVMRVQPKKMRITSAATRWGSCSTSGTVSFSYKLIMTPEEILNYVVVHELAHITHHNHSKNFWQEVAKYYPNHQEARAWLRNHSYITIDL